MPTELPGEAGQDQPSFDADDSTDTAQIQRAEALQESESQLQFLFETMTQGVVFQDAETRIIKANRAASVILGIPMDQLLGKTNYDQVWTMINEQAAVFPPDAMPSSIALRTGLPVRNVICGIRKRSEHEYRWVLISATPRCRPGGTAPEGVATTFTDVTDLKRTEEALRKSETTINAIFRAAPIGIGVTDKRVFVEVNDRFTDLTGYSRDELLGHNTRMLYPNQEEYERFTRIITPEYLAKGRGRAETRWQRKDGAIIDVHIASTPLDVCNTSLAIVTALDITAPKRAEEALRENLHFTNHLLATSPNAIYVYDLLEHRNVFHNPRLATLLGFTLAQWEAMGASAGLECIHPDDIVRFRDHLAIMREATDNQVIEIEYRVQHRNGQWRWVRSYDTPFLRDAQGKVKQLMGVGIDITERKELANTLCHERDLAQLYLDIAGVVIVAIDTTQRVTLINRKGCELLGYPPEDILGKNWYLTFVPERYRMRVVQGAKELMEGGLDTEVNYENPVVIRSGEERLVSWYNKVMRDETGQVIGTLSSGEDITDRRRAEDTVKRERALLASAIELLPFPIFFASTNQTIFRTNQACREFLHEDGLDQWFAISLLDQNTHKPIANEDRALTRLLAGESVHPPREVTMVFPDGREMPALLYMAPIAVGEESIAAVIAFQDITSLKEADQAKTQFLKVISHELRTPLTSIIGWAKMLEEAPELMPEAVPIILQSAYQFEGMLERMIILSRILTGKLTAHLETMNLCTLVTEIVIEFEPAAARKGVTLTWVPPAESSRTQGDTHLLRIAITELLDNAINFTPSGGSVTLTCHTTSDGRVTFSVTDTGRGIIAEELPNIMKPFSQFRREEAIGGIGIGLTLVQGIARAHHGEVEVTSPGCDQGTTVTLYLPPSSETPPSHEAAPTMKD